MELREEQVVPRVESVQSGVVRVGKEIVTDVKTLEVPVHAERVVVEKVPILREEVRVGKQVVPEVAKVNATARKERAVVDVEGDAEVKHRPARRRARS